MLKLRLAGVEVQVDRSWVLTLIAVTALAARSANAVTPEEVGLPLSVTIGAAVAIALTVSLLIHELAHARVSINSGVRVDYIRVHAAGALCRRLDPIEHADHQFSVAAAGPLASVALGVVSLGAAFAVELAGAPGAIGAALAFIAFSNVMIAASNMLPLFPFDGGKVLHAVMWRATGDRAAARERVRRSGRQLARIVVALGIIMMGWAGELLLGVVISAFGIYLMFLPPAD